MAKKHIRFLARQLVDKYAQAEKILADAGLATKDILFSPEEQTEFSKHKAEVDGYLSLVSVALSAAAQGKIESLIDKAHEEHDTYAASLHQAVLASHDKALSEEERAQNQQLADLYARKATDALLPLVTLYCIRFVANAPVKIYKQKKYFGTIDLPAALAHSADSVFSNLDDAIKSFTDYVASLSTAEQQLSRPEDDLLE